MDTISTVYQPIHYPETDGKPMGETDVHIDALIYLREALRDHFRDAPQVYVAGNMFLYCWENICGRRCRDTGCTRVSISVCDLQERRG